MKRWSLLLVLSACASRPLYVPEPVDAPDLGTAPDLSPPDLSPPDLAEPGDLARGDLAQAPDLSRCGWQPLVTYTRPHQQWLAASGDFDGDGHADVATADYATFGYPRLLAVSLGRGDGSFAEAQLFPLSTSPDSNFNPLALAAADFDGDGTSDLVVLSGWQGAGGRVEVWRGGALERIYVDQVPEAFPWGPRALAVADADGDGRLDLVEQHQALLVVRLGRGDGTFGAPIATEINLPDAPPSPWEFLATGDFDEDGHLDAVVTLRGTSTRIRLFSGRGDGGFDRGADIVVPWPAGGLAPLDTDGDGHLDVVVENGNGGRGLLQGRGDGSFTVTPSSDSGVPRFSRWLDLDGDGVLERLAWVDGELDVMRFRPDGTWAHRQSPIDDEADYWFALAAADFDGDGDTDVMLTGQHSRAVFIGDGQDGFAAQPPRGAGWPEAVALADFDGDGRLDAVIASAMQAILTLRRGQPGGTLGPPEDTHGAAFPDVSGFIAAAVLPGDFDRDGRLDVLLVGNESASFMKGAGDGSFTALGIPQLRGALRVAAGDLDGDGILDVVMNGEWVCLGKGDGSFGTAQRLGLDPPAQEPFFTLGDLNGDGAFDLVLHNAKRLRVHLGKGDGSFGKSAVFALDGGFWGQPQASDLDGDGRLDLAVIGGTGVLTLGGRGDGTFEAPRVHALSQRPQSILAGDFDGDGVPDVVTGYDKRLGIDWLRGQGDGNLAAAIRFPAGEGVITETLSAGDLDGDGDPDLVGLSSWDNSVSVLRNELTGCQ